MEKIIHYCWFGGKSKPRQLKKYMKTWKKYLPDYKFMEWNEQNFDVNMTEFSKEAYKHKKWAFVSDVARIYALKEYGGIYFDTDIEVTKSLEHILNDSVWFGRENSNFLATAMIGVKEKQNKHIINLFEMYKESKFNIDDMYAITGPKLITSYCKKIGLTDGEDSQVIENDVHIYAKDYFNPKSYDGSNETFTENTCIIHHFDATWTGTAEKIAIWLVRKRLGFLSKYVFEISDILKRIKGKIKRMLKK